MPNILRTIIKIYVHWYLFNFINFYFKEKLEI